MLEVFRIQSHHVYINTFPQESKLNADKCFAAKFEVKTFLLMLNRLWGSKKFEQKLENVIQINSSYQGKVMQLWDRHSICSPSLKMLKMLLSIKTFNLNITFL